MKSNKQRFFLLNHIHFKLYFAIGLLIAFAFLIPISQVEASALEFSTENQRVHFYRFKMVQNTSSGEKLLKNFRIKLDYPNYTLVFDFTTIHEGDVLTLEIYRVDTTVNAFITINRVTYDRGYHYAGWSGAKYASGIRVDPLFFRKGDFSAKYRSELEKYNASSIQENENEFGYTIKNTSIVYYKNGILKSLSSSGNTWNLTFELEGSSSSLHGLMGVEILGLVLFQIGLILIIFFFLNREYYNQVLMNIKQSFKTVVFGYREYLNLSKEESLPWATLFIVVGVSSTALSRCFPLSWLTNFPFWIWIAFFNFFLYESVRAIIWISLTMVMIWVGIGKRNLKRIFCYAAYSYGALVFLFNAIIYLLFVNTTTVGGAPWGPIIIQYFNPMAAIWMLICAFYELRTIALSDFSLDKETLVLGREKAYATFVSLKMKLNITWILWVFLIIVIHLLFFPDYFEPVIWIEIIQLY